MDLIQLMDKKNYTCIEDITLADLKELGECITDNMSIGALNELIENLLYD